MRLTLLPAILVLAASLGAGAAVQADDGGSFSFGGDIYAGGRTVAIDGGGQDSAFGAGYAVTLSGDLTGSAHLAGRRVSALGAVGGNLYAAGQEVRAEGAVAGDATLAGETVTVAGGIGGNLRAVAAELAVSGPVAGAALLSGGAVAISGTIAGDAAITAESVTFGPEARIDGRIDLYEATEGQLVVPGSVAPEDRITRHLIEADESGLPAAVPGMNWRARSGGMVGRMIAVAVLAGLAAALSPAAMASLAGRIASRPWRALGRGFLGLSALLGAAVLVALTLVGIVLSPVAILAAAILGCAGYVTAAWTIGARLLARGGAPGLGARLAAAVVGAVIAVALGLVPWVGWLVTLALVWAGSGGLIMAMADRRRIRRAGRAG